MIREASFRASDSSEGIGSIDFDRFLLCVGALADATLVSRMRP